MISVVLFLFVFLQLCIICVNLNHFIFFYCLLSKYYTVTLHSSVAFDIMFRSCYYHCMRVDICWLLLIQYSGISISTPPCTNVIVLYNMILLCYTCWPCYHFCLWKIECLAGVLIVLLMVKNSPHDQPSGIVVMNFDQLQ